MKVVRNEPVLTAAVAFTTAVIAVLVAFGVNLTQTQQAAVVGLVIAGIGLAAVVRSRVKPRR
jgi:predicted anti-sigma-YlaC factor YlaD